MEKNKKTETSDASSSKTEESRAFASEDFGKNSVLSALLSQVSREGVSGLGSIIEETPTSSTQNIPSEYQNKPTSDILSPELNLRRLGSNRDEAIDWNKVPLPAKEELNLGLRIRIPNKNKPDCRVHIGGEVIHCHFLVLQCYSKLFNNLKTVSKVEISSEKCTANSFMLIYEWMIREHQSYKLLSQTNVLDTLKAARYLEIEELENQCWSLIDNVKVFNEKTAFLLYVDAKQKNLPEVQELMNPRIRDFFLILVSSLNWLELDVEEVIDLLSSNWIRINCEMEVFMAAVRWLMFDWKRRNKLKLKVLECVRFAHIDPWQLVDIKRNPENQEFIELAADPSISKLIDDGLSLAIIKKYLHDDESFQQWIAMLGLRAPDPRNWSGLNVTYFTYRDFLIHLDQNRRRQWVERSKPRSSAENNQEMVAGPSGMSMPSGESGE